MMWDPDPGFIDFLVDKAVREDMDMGKKVSLEGRNYSFGALLAEMKTPNASPLVKRYYAFLYDDLGPAYRSQRVNSV